MTTNIKFASNAYAHGKSRTMGNASVRRKQSTVASLATRTRIPPLQFELSRVNPQRETQVEGWPAYLKRTLRDLTSCCLERERKSGREDFPRTKNVEITKFNRNQLPKIIYIDLGEVKMDAKFTGFACCREHVREASGNMNVDGKRRDEGPGTPHFGARLQSVENDKLSSASEDPRSSPGGEFDCSLMEERPVRTHPDSNFVPKKFHK